jgi:hypothetical protein
MPFRVSYPNVVATLCLIALVGAGGVAAVAQSGGGRQLAACYKKRGKAKGAMRFLAKSSARCKKGEKKVTWNRTGPPGPAGQPGPAGGGGGAPAGAVLFFDLASCPAGWSAYANAQGRYVVGLNPGGALAATVGTALTDQQNRATGQHSHTITDPGHSHGVNGSGAALRVPSAILSFAGRGAISTLPPAPNATTTGIMSAQTGITVDESAGVAGTNAPYVQLLACRKD